MVIRTEETYIRAKVVYSVIIYTDNKTRIVRPRSWLTPPKTEEYTTYKLVMDYVSESEDRLLACWTSDNINTLKKLHLLIIGQIKAQDHEYVDRIFEEAVLKAERENQ